MRLLAVFVAAVVLYLPTARYGFVQDDRAIVAGNPAAHSIGAAVRAFDDPYWPAESGAGLYRPLTIFSFAVDWSISGGRPGWIHIMNAWWHGLVTVLVALLLARWLPAPAAAIAGLLFAWHPVHVEAVAGLVGRAELLAAAGILGGVLAARRGWWWGAVACAALAMLSKEHGVIAGVVILLDRWLDSPDGRPYPRALWIALSAVTIGFVVVWFAVGRAGASDVAPVFLERGAGGRLAVALPAIARAAALLVWPVSLSIDYGPQVIPAREGVSLAALGGTLLLVAVPVGVVWLRRRAPALALALAVGALAYLPTANVLFASGVVLAERNLYLAALVPAVALGLAMSRAPRPALMVPLAILVVVACGAKSLDRLPAWRDNRAALLTLLADHPESSRAHASAAAVLAGLGDRPAALREYRAADSLFPGDPYVTSAYAILLLSGGDTAAAVTLAGRLAALRSPQALVLARRVRFLVSLSRGDTAAAREVSAQAILGRPSEAAWYHQYLQ